MIRFPPGEVSGFRQRARNELARHRRAPAILFEQLGSRGIGLVDSATEDAMVVPRHSAPACAAHDSSSAARHTRPGRARGPSQGPCSSSPRSSHSRAPTTATRFASADELSRNVKDRGRLRAADSSGGYPSCPRSSGCPAYAPLQRHRRAAQGRARSGGMQVSGRSRISARANASEASARRAASYDERLPMRDSVARRARARSAGSQDSGPRRTVRTSAKRRQSSGPPEPEPCWGASRRRRRI